MEEKDLEFLNSFTEKLEKTVVDLCSADELLDGKMLEEKFVDSCNLAANPRYTLTFSGTASYVTAFVLEPDGSFTPHSDAKTDPDLNH